MPPTCRTAVLTLVCVATSAVLGGGVVPAAASTEETPTITVNAGSAEFSVAVATFAPGDVSRITWSRDGATTTVLDPVDPHPYWSGRIGRWDWVTVEVQRHGSTVASKHVGVPPSAAKAPVGSRATAAVAVDAEGPRPREVRFVRGRDQFSVSVSNVVPGDVGLLTWSVGGTQRTRLVNLSTYPIWSGVIGPWQWASLTVSRHGQTLSTERVVGPAPTAAPSTRPHISTLPKKPWDGGPAYWSKFAKAEAAGWTDPSFFPIAAWYDFTTSPQEAPRQLAYDKAVGINTWTGSNRVSAYPTADQFEKAGVFFVGAPMNATFDATARNYVGTILEDEVDMWFLQKRVAYGDGKALDQAAGMLSNGRREDQSAGLFRYANFGFTIAGNDMPTPASAERLVNDTGVDVNSITSYPYSNEFCARPFDITFLAALPPRKNCVSATSYGRLMSSLDARDRADGVDVPTWGFVEAYDGGLGGADGITPDQLRGAVMSHIIHGARGINYFLHDRESVKNGPLVTNVLRQAQWGNDKYRPNVEAMRAVNGQIQALARVLNTQSTEWDAGPGVDTLLKVYGGHAYLFAMADAGGAGTRTIQVPGGLAGRVTVLDEGRELSIANGRFSDEFGTNASYHIYKIALDQD